MDHEDRNGKERKKFDDQFEERLHKQYTDIEEEYHAAYPDTPAPWTMGFLTGLFGRYGRGFLLWALVGAAVAAAFWIAYIIFFEQAA